MCSLLKAITTNISLKKNQWTTVTSIIHEADEQVPRNSIYPNIYVNRTDVDGPILVYHKIYPWMNSINEGTQEETWTKEWERWLARPLWD